MNNSKIFEKILLWIIYLGSCLVVAVPLIVVPKSYFPYIILKTIIWRTIVEAIFISWLILIFYHSQYRPKKTLLFWLLGFFTLIWFISTLTSQSFIKSFWGNWERMGGFFNFLHYFLWWLVIVNVFKNIKQWYRLLNFSLLVSVIMCLYSIGQRFGLAFTLEAGLTRVNGTIGNAAYLAAYLLFNIFIAWYFFAKATGWPKKLVYLVAFGLQIFILLLTSTRGAQLAFIIALVLFLIFSFIFNFYREKSARLFVIISALVVVGGLFILVFHNQSWVKNNYYLGRFSSLSFKDNTIQTRLISWRAGAQGFKDYLLFGVGPENYNIVFNRYFTPDFYKYTGDEVWFDRAHNTVVDMAVMLGIFGLLGYLAIFMAVFYILWHFYKRQGYVVNLVILALLFAAYFIQNVFVFDSLNSYIPFFMMLGLIDFFNRLNKENKIEEEKDILSLPKPLVVSIGIIIFSVLLVSINLRQAAACQATYRGYVAERNSNYEEFMESYSQSITKSLNPVDSIFLMVQDMSDVVIKNLNNLPSEKIKKGFSQVAQYADRGISIDSKNVYNYYLLAKFYNGYAEITKEGIYLNKALEILNIAKKLSPNLTRLYWVEAQTYIIAGQYEKAIAALDQSIALINTVPDPYWFKYVIYTEQNQTDLAYLAAAQAIKYNYRFNNVNDVKELIPYFEQTQDQEILLSLYQKVISFEPRNVAYYEKLASLYEKRGEINKAIDIIKKAAQVVPAYSDRAYELYSILEKKL